jgi:hypothetical protein
LPHGAFGPWLELEFEWTVRTAQNYMRLAETLGEKAQHVSHLPMRAVYSLSAPSTPDTARQAVLAQVERGERPDEVEVHQLIKEHKAAAAQERKAVRAKAAADKLTPEQRKKREKQEQRKQKRLLRAQREAKLAQEKSEAEVSAARELANLLLQHAPGYVIDKLARLLGTGNVWAFVGELRKLADQRSGHLGP